MLADIIKTSNKETIIPFKKIALLKGGWSREREISLRSAKAMLETLQEIGREQNFVIKEFDFTKDVLKLIKDLTSWGANLICLNALHGKFSEDGHIQGLMTLLNLPYTGTNLCSSAVAMDKEITKYILQANNIPTPQGYTIYSQDLCNQAITIPYPVVIKPIDEGSSIGVFIVNEQTDLAEIKSNWEYGAKMLIEEYIPGCELAVPMINNYALGIIELIPRSGFYDYQAKYTADFTQHIFPQNIEHAYKEIIVNYAKKVVKLLKIYGVSRVDLRYNATIGKAYILEVNTLPGMTDLSLLPEVASSINISYKDLCEWIIKNPTYPNKE